MSKTFKIADIECPVNEGKNIVASVTDEEGQEIVKEFPENLVPEALDFVVEENEKDDYARYALLGAKKGQHVLLEGPAGTGKTTTIAYLAAMTNNPLIYVQLNGATGLDSLVGKWLVNKEGTFWVDGPLTLAWKYGYWICLDELNMALPEITAVLHSMLDDRGILICDEKGTDTKDGNIVPKHPNARVFACINPTEDYAGTKEMNAALRDRFGMKLHVPYPAARKEVDIVLANKKVEIDNDKSSTGITTKDGVVTRMVKVANALRKMHKDNELIFQCSTRNLIEWASLCSDLPVKDAARVTLLAAADQESNEQKKIADQINLQFDDKERWVEKASRKKVTSEDAAEVSESLSKF